MTQQVNIPEPRDITRLVYGQAIRQAVTEGERQAILAALGWYEMKWAAQERARQEAEAPPPA
jgi:hypothetical protein